MEDVKKENNLEPIQDSVHLMPDRGTKEERKQIIKEQFKAKQKKNTKSLSLNERNNFEHIRDRNSKTWHYEVNKFILQFIFVFKENLNVFQLIFKTHSLYNEFTSSRKYPLRRGEEKLWMLGCKLN